MKAIRRILLWLILPASLVLAQQECTTLEIGIEETLVLSSQTPNCFATPGTASEYRLTIRNSVYGRYSIVHGSTGFSWNEPADGIYYCVAGATPIVFDEYVEGATVTVTTEEVTAGEDCFSDFISFNGFVPIPPPETNGTEVHWSSHRYYLRASSFEYQVQGEDPVSLESATSIDVSGDPGDDTYASIEITWVLNGLEKRLDAYMEADATSWRIYEMRVYDATEEWVYFQDPGVAGERENCFKADNLLVSDGQGSEIRFEGLAFAAFLPWPEEMAFLECIGRLDESEESTNPSLSPTEIPANAPTSNNVTNQGPPMPTPPTPSSSAHSMMLHSRHGVALGATVAAVFVQLV